ncbi:MAG TPA: hypothetical protein H9840_06075 [Candidatus Anaerofilum excrementigallinarum]|nr:hypothetical protein [Candidatus Anaerofilum excrementigallinarum]
MPRGVKQPVEYTGKAARANEKVLRLEQELRQARLERKLAYKEQLKEQKAQAGKRQKEEQQMLMKAIRESGKSMEELLQAIQG